MSIGVHDQRVERHDAPGQIRKLGHELGWINPRWDVAAAIEVELSEKRIAPRHMVHQAIGDG
jgi:hypothetical protein